MVENPRDVFDPQWSPDGKRIAFLSYNKHPPSLFILDLATRQTHEFENVWLFDWSRDGQALVFCEYGTWPWAEDETFHFYLVQMEDLDHPRVVMVAPWRAIELRWSPTADRILASGGRQVGADLATHLYLFDLQGRVQQLPITEVPGGHVAWHPDGEQIAYDVYNDTVTVVSEIRGLDLRTFEGQALTHSGEIAEYPEWSPDGKRVAFISKPLLKNSTTLPTYRVSLLDLETGKTTQLETRLKEKHMLFPTWSPDGKYLAFLQGAETPGTWLTLSYSLNIYDLRAGRITTLLRQGLDQTAPDWKPQR